MPTPDEVVTLLVTGDWRNVTPCADGEFSGRFDDIAARLATWMERRTFGPPVETSDDIDPLKELRQVAVLLTGAPRLPAGSPAGLFGWATAGSVAQMWVPQPDQPLVRPQRGSPPGYCRSVAGRSSTSAGSSP
jgi:hypothetical protein